MHDEYSANDTPSPFTLLTCNHCLLLDLQSRQVYSEVVELAFSSLVIPSTQVSNTKLFYLHLYTPNILTHHSIHHFVVTASRMESTGCPGRIQISQATADLLHARGKAHWLTPRTDKVMAKGKGEMQTFFITTSDRKLAYGRHDLTETSDHLIDQVFIEESGIPALGTLKEEDHKSDDDMEDIEDQLRDYLTKSVRGESSHHSDF